jgi:beta-exotoxin I transport system ATP-binding protein
VHTGLEGLHLRFSRYEGALIPIAFSGVPDSAFDAIETSGFTKVFGSTRAVDDLDLRVESGQIFGFLGPNGAGKTTTIRALLDLHRPTAGTVRVLGLDAHRDAVVIHRRVGYLPGELALFGRMTARDHVASFARARGLALDQPVTELSKGNRQKVGIVLAFMHEPELLVLDEPTAGLDPLMKDEFEQLLRETKRAGRTVFLSSHELDEVQRVADRVGIIKDGHLIRTDTVDGLRRSAPKTLELLFAAAVDPAAFHIDGVRVVRVSDAHLVLEVTGPVGPVLRIAADHNLLDLVSRQADLDELFLDFYRDHREVDDDAS